LVGIWTVYEESAPLTLDSVPHKYTRNRQVGLSRDGVLQHVAMEPQTNAWLTSTINRSQL